MAAKIMRIWRREKGRATGDFEMEELTASDEQASAGIEDGALLRSGKAVKDDTLIRF